MNLLWTALHQLDLPTGVSLVGTEIDGRHQSKLSVALPDLPSPGPRCAQKRIDQFYAGRWCAANAVEKLIGEFVVPEIGTDRAPVWPKGVCGSISHTDELAIAGAAICSNVLSMGLDVENLESVPEAAEWASQVASEEEFELCDIQNALGLLFSAKESLYKALNPLTGTFFDFRDAQAVSCDSSQITLRLKVDLSSEFRRGSSFSVRYLIVPPFLLTLLVVMA